MNQEVKHSEQSEWWSRISAERHQYVFPSEEHIDKTFESSGDLLCLVVTICKKYVTALIVSALTSDKLSNSDCGLKSWNNYDIWQNVPRYGGHEMQTIAECVKMWRGGTNHLTEWTTDVCWIRRLINFAEISWLCLFYKTGESVWRWTVDLRSDVLRRAEKWATIEWQLSEHCDVAASKCYDSRRRLAIIKCRQCTADASLMYHWHMIRITSAVYFSHLTFPHWEG